MGLVHPVASLDDIFAVAVATLSSEMCSILSASTQQSSVYDLPQNQWGGFLGVFVAYSKQQRCQLVMPSIERQQRVGVNLVLDDRWLSWGLRRPCSFSTSRIVVCALCARGRNTDVPVGRKDGRGVAKPSDVGRIFRNGK